MADVAAIEKEIADAGNTVRDLKVKLKAGAKADPATVRIRHKTPSAGRATENAFAFKADHVRASFKDASKSFQIATMVAAFAEKLRERRERREEQQQRAEEASRRRDGDRAQAARQVAGGDPSQAARHVAGRVPRQAARHVAGRDPMPSTQQVAS